MKVIAYDRWQDFADLLEARGRINTAAIPEQRREEIVASWPHGAYIDGADPNSADYDADRWWEENGGPWFDELEHDLGREGHGRQTTIVIDRVDIAQLRAQRRWVVAKIGDEQSDEGEGLLNLLDELLDRAEGYARP
jgi:hypothetical protein